MADTPWLSVLMPTFNGEAYLRASLDSLLDQTSVPMECIVVDDASTDGTLQILAGYQDRLDLSIIRHSHQGNWIKSTNEALQAARGEYIAILHQDDTWLPGRLAGLAAYMRAHPGITLLLGSAHFLNSNGRRIGAWHCPLPPSPTPLDSQLLLERLLVQNFIPMPAPIVKRDLALEVGGLDQGLWYTADWDFWLKLASRAATAYIPRPSVGFRIHSTSQTVMGSADSDDMRSQLTAVGNRHLMAWDAASSVKRRVRRLSDFSTDLNVALARAAHGGRPALMPLVSRFLTLGPLDQYTYLRDSRIIERLAARIRAGIW